MIYTYTTARSYYGKLTNNSSSGNLTDGDEIINSEIGRVLSVRPFPFLDRETTTTTVANQQYVEVPANFRKIKTVRVQQGTTNYHPKEVPSRQFWDNLNSVTASSYTSNAPEWFYLFNGRVYIWPTPSVAGTTTVYGRIGFNRLNIADNTTGTITTATTGSTTVVGSGTSWHALMAGRFIRITEADSANSGDDEWYEIASVTNTTTIVLVKPYLGASIAAGSAALTIGQTIPLPDGYQEIPIYRAVQIYYSKIDQARYVHFKNMADGLEGGLIGDHGSATDSVVIEDGDDGIINPNLTVRL